MAGTHKILSPSKASMWSRCLGSLAMAKGMPDESSEYADEGTAYHYVSEQALNTGMDCSDWIGTAIVVTRDTVYELEDPRMEVPKGARSFVVDADNAAYAQKYVDTIRENTLCADFKVEVKIDLSALLGVPDQGGTADCVIFNILNETIEVHDLKFGRGEIVHAFTAPAEGQPSWMGANEQLLLYAAGALLQFKDVCNWKAVKIAIHQPRVGHYTYHTFRRDQVREFIRHMADRAKQSYNIYDTNDYDLMVANLTPGEKQCRWCKRRGDCPARTNQVLEMFPLMPADQRLVKTGGIVNKIQTVVNPTPVLWQLTDEQLADARNRVDDIKQWCKDIENEAYSRALSLELQGKELPGWKFTIGRKGNRAWAKEAHVVLADDIWGELAFTPEEFLVEAIGQAAYDKPTLISPTTAEKLMKSFPEKWAQLQSVITQSDGAKTLVRATDPRPAAEATTAQFGLTDEFGANV